MSVYSESLDDERVYEYTMRVWDHTETAYLDFDISIEVYYCDEMVATKESHYSIYLLGGQALEFKHTRSVEVPCEPIEFSVKNTTTGHSFLNSDLFTFRNGPDFGQVTIQSTEKSGSPGLYKFEIVESSGSIQRKFAYTILVKQDRSGIMEAEISNTDSEGDPSEAWISEEEEQDNGDERESEVGKTA